MGTFKYKNYCGSIEYNEEDNCLYGKVLGLSKVSISYEGTNVDDLKRNFEVSIDDYIERCKFRNEKPAVPYKGNLNVRLGTERHCTVAMNSIQDGISINAYINNAIDFYNKSRISLLR